ncbi:MAG: hypothetical protein ACK5LK_02670 [Chthoniobacterales bacterium]
MPTSLCRYLPLLLVLCAYLFLLSGAEARVFTDKQGQTVEGEVVGVFGDLVSIKRKDNSQVLRVKFSDFSEKDQQFLQASGMVKDAPTSDEGSALDGVMPKVDLNVSVKKSDVLSKIEMYDDRLQELRFTVKVINRDLKRGLEKVKGTLLVFARSLINRNVYQVVGKEEFEFELKPLGNFEFNMENPITLLYKSRDMTRFGMKYYGYVCLLTDASGRTVEMQTIPSNLKDKLENCIALELYDVCNKDFKFMEKGSKPYTDYSRTY